MKANQLIYFAGLILCILLSNKKLLAQSVYGEVGSTGAMSSAGGSGDVNTNLATGTIAPSLSLVSLPGVAGSIPVGLQYTAGSGVRVNDAASEVGLGWTLVGGGSIVREVKGMPDDGAYGWFIDCNIAQVCFNGAGPVPPHRGSFKSAGDAVRYFKHDYTYTYPNGGIEHYGATEQAILYWLYPASQMASFSQYSAATWTPNQPNNIANNPYAEWAGVFIPDTEPDIFTISLPTGKIQFVFDSEGNPLVLQAQNIKIEALNLGSRIFSTTGLLQEFVVTTSDGVKYYFGSSQGSDAFRQSIAVTTRLLQLSEPSKDDYSCVNTWYLRTIVYPSGEQVNYTYSSGKDFSIATNNYLQQDYAYTTRGGTLLDPYHLYQPVPANITNPSPNWSFRYTARTTVLSTNCKQLERIENSQGSIVFTYQSVSRKDVGGTTAALAGLLLYDKKDHLVKRLDLVQHYAEATQVTDAMPYDRYHLMLDRIIDRGAGCDYTRSYQMEYNSQSFCRNAATKDDWGYLNGITYPTNNILVGACSRPTPYSHPFSFSGRDRTPSLSYTQALILQNITAASGAVQSFVYELHDCYSALGSLDQPIGGLRIQSTTKYDGIDHNHDIIDAFAYKKASNTTQSSGCWADAGLYAKLQLIHGYGPQGVSNQPSYRPNAATIRGAIPTCITSADWAYRDNWYDFYYLLRSDASMYQCANDYIDYSCVTVSHGQKGKTRYQFTSWGDVEHQDYVDSDTRQQANNLNVCPNERLNPTRRGQFLPLPFANLQLDGVAMDYADGVTANFTCRSSRAAERGLPVVITQLDNANIPVASTFNTYDFTHTFVALPTVNAVVVKPDMEVFGFSQYPRYFQSYYYNVASQWCPLKESTEIVYNQQAAGDIAKSIANTTMLEYNTNLFPSKIIKYTSRCTTATDLHPPLATSRYYVTEFRRALDFTNATLESETTPGLLRSAGMVAQVIEQEQYSLDALGGNKVEHLGASLSIFQILSTGQVVPYQNYSSPFTSSFTPAYTYALPKGKRGLAIDASYVLTSTINGYTTNALPVNSVGRDGIPQATIWGYNHTLPIAQVKGGSATSGNSLVANAAHTSFEEDGQNGMDGDGWSVPSFCLTEAKTGERSERIVINQSPYGAGKEMIFSSGSNRLGKMIFSCWAKVPKQTTNGLPTDVDFGLVAEGRGGSTGRQSINFTALINGDWKYVQLVIDLDDSKWGNGLFVGNELPIAFYPFCISGNELLIDEVRVHRADAHMQTTTYQPLVGQTSTTGPDGRSTYFTYTADNAPSLVLNHNKDVISRTKSRYVNQKSLSADFTAPSYGFLRDAVDFTAELSSCTDGATFIWDFDEGVPPISGNAQESHVFTSAGTHQVSLIVTHPERGVAKVTKAITMCNEEVQIYTIDGNTSVEYCGGIGLSTATFEAVVSNTCSAVVSYQWQEQTSNGYWVNVPADYYPPSPGTRYTVSVPCVGSINNRCIVTYANGTTNENNAYVLTCTGVVAMGCQCP